MVSACILICCELRKYTEVTKMVKGVNGVYLSAGGGMPITERYAPRSELDKLTPCYSFFNSVFMLDYCYLAKIFFKRHSAIEEAKKMDIYLRLPSLYLPIPQSRHFISLSVFSMLLLPQ